MLRAMKHDHSATLSIRSSCSDNAIMRAPDVSVVIAADNGGDTWCESASGMTPKSGRTRDVIGRS
jgi:hypothetical protein